MEMAVKKYQLMDYSLILEDSSIFSILNLYSSFFYPIPFEQCLRES